MKDLETIQYLKRVCNFIYTMTEDHCTEISFYSDDEPFGGTIRKLPNKPDILDKVSKMPFLKKINLRKCKVGILPTFLSKSLEYIDLSCNDLEIVPGWVVKQPNLKFLSVGANKIKEVPTFDHLPLETLKLHKNSITKEPVVNNNLKSLNLYLNPLPIFPELVLGLRKLEVLSLGVTNILKLPPISSLQNLKWLTLTVNPFKHLPEDICELKKLEGLQLAKNQLESLPQEIGKLSNLKVLTVYNNNLFFIPDSLFDLNLSKLNLAGNQLESYKSRVLDKFKNIDFLRI